MLIPYEQLCSSWNTVPGVPYMRLPSYKSLRRRRYHPYTATRARLSSASTSMMECAEDIDFEDDPLPVSVFPAPAPFSLPPVLEDDCMAGLRTVVSQMTGKVVSVGSVHLVIDFALIFRQRNRLRKGDPVAV